MRKRVSISISETVHTDLGRIARDYGFRTVTSLLDALLRLFIARVIKAEDIPTLDYSMTQEIDEMFAELSEGNTPENTHIPVRDRTKTRKIR